MRRSAGHRGGGLGAHTAGAARQLVAEPADGGGAPGDAAGRGSAAPDPQPRFDITAGAGQQPALVRAAGDIDLNSAPQFEAALTKAAATSSQVTADMTAVTYCDSAAIHVLLTMAGRTRLTLIVPDRGPITTMLKITGLDQVASVVAPGEGPARDFGH